MLIDKWLLTHYFRFFSIDERGSINPYMLPSLCVRRIISSVKCIDFWVYCKSKFVNWPWTQLKTVGQRWNKMEIWMAEALKELPCKLVNQLLSLEVYKRKPLKWNFCNSFDHFYGTHHYSSSNFRHESIHIRYGIHVQLKLAWKILPIFKFAKWIKHYLHLCLLAKFRRLTRFKANICLMCYQT